MERLARGRPRHSGWPPMLRIPADAPGASDHGMIIRAGTGFACNRMIRIKCCQSVESPHTTPALTSLKAYNAFETLLVRM